MSKRLQLRRAVRAAGCFDRYGGKTVRAFLGRWRCDRFRFLHAVHGADDQEDYESYDDEINDRLNEGSIFYDGGAHSDG